MNFCTKCGAKLSPDDKFCPKCGAPVRSSEEPEKPQSTQQGIKPQNNPYMSQTNPYMNQQQTSTQQTAGNNNVPPFASQPVTTPKKPFSFDTRLIIPLAIAAAVVIALIIGIVYYRHSYNLRDYCEVKFTGYENYGTAEVDFDDDKLTEKLEKRAGLSEKDLDDYDSFEDFGGDFKKALRIESFVESIEPEVTSKGQDELSNGDTVKVKISYSKSSAKKLGYHIHGTTFTTKVKGLQKADVTDPFREVTITYEGALPYLKPVVNVSDESDFVSDDFTFDGSTGKVDNGDHFYLTKPGEKFTVKVDGNNDPENGLVFARHKRVYKLGKCSQYISKVSDLSDSDRKQLIGYSMKCLTDGYIDSDNIKFVGCIAQLQDPSEYNSDIDPEFVTMVFSYRTEDYWSEDMVTMYAFVNISDVARQSDGTLSFDDTSDAQVGYEYESIDDVKTFVLYDSYNADMDKILK